MPVLSYKTRNDSDPRGKPRVYFTCHPEDFEPFFSSTAELLLSRQNCAVWYKSAPESFFEDEAETDLALGQMQLMVIPVTTKLLTLPNSAIDRELPYAEAHHIPILPLMEEPGLADVYKSRFGSLQYLDPHGGDETALGFEEKLDRFLSGVLVGDELAAKVRAAFDAYIFLSYRKKDRAYAQTLMRLIHSIPACRDLAIWYDEFLTPGENFNDAIAEALKRSRIFAMVVTPNLVNEDNYVRRTEYPMAQAEDKPILPVEMASTDPDALSGSFDGLPPCLPGRFGRQFTDGFLRVLRSLAIQESDDTPEHNFFIGLAYLDGIDVEVDHRRALELITGAAEAGLTEAMEKLISMYAEGKGVARSYETSVLWREKLVDALRQRGDQDALFDALKQLGRDYRDLGRMEKALAVYNEMLSIAQAMEPADSVEARRRLSDSNYYIGVTREAQGRLPEAREWYERSLALDEALAAESGEARDRRGLSFNYLKLGDIELDTGRLDEARARYDRALELRLGLVEEDPAPANRRLLSTMYNTLGYLEETCRRYPEAKAFYEKALELRQALAAEEGSDASLRNLAIVYLNLGDIEELLDDLDASRAWYEKALAIREEQVKKTGTIQARRSLGLCYGRMGNNERLRGHMEEALAWYGRELSITEALAAETGTLTARRDLSINYGRMGKIEARRRFTDRARAWFEKELGITETLAAETGTLTARRDLSVTYDRLALLARDTGKLEEARDWFLKELAIAEALAAEAETPQLLHDLYLIYRELGDLEESAGDLTAARSWFEKALAPAEAYAGATGDSACADRVRTALRRIAEHQANAKGSSDKDLYKNRF